MLSVVDTLIVTCITNTQLCQHTHLPKCRERNAGEKAQNALDGMKAELSAMHDAMASLHGEMGAMQREVSVYSSHPA